MSEESDDKERSCWVTYSLLAFLVVVVYPLSIGPSYRLAVQEYYRGNTLPYDAYSVFYHPLRLVFRVLGKSEWLFNYAIWWKDL